jgi:hypothetical protein
MRLSRMSVMLMAGPLSKIAGEYDSISTFFSSSIGTLSPPVHDSSRLVCRKYYDDCAQILSEHILASLKPDALRCFSTLDPMVTENLDDDEVSLDASRRSRVTTFDRVARMLKGEPGEDEDDTLSATSAQSMQPTTLEEGAIPVRDFPDELTSEPASICPSPAGSEIDNDEETRRQRMTSIQGSHKEELRCVIAVVRHGDRTPKQKLKVDISEPGILEYFHSHTSNCRKDLKVKAKTPMLEFLATVKKMIAEKEVEATTVQDDMKVNSKDITYKLKHMRDILERWKIAGLNRKLQIKPRE